MGVLRKKPEDADFSKARGKSIGEVGDLVGFDRMAIEPGLERIEAVGRKNGKAD